MKAILECLGALELTFYPYSDSGSSMRDDAVRNLLTAIVMEMVKTPEQLQEASQYYEKCDLSESLRRWTTNSLDSTEMRLILDRLYR